MSEAFVFGRISSCSVCQNRRSIDLLRVSPPAQILLLGFGQLDLWAVYDLEQLCGLMGLNVIDQKTQRGTVVVLVFQPLFHPLAQSF